MRTYVKRRGLAEPGSIAEALDMFRSEVRFYQEIAAVAGVRVPACYDTNVSADGTVLVLEDLSAWQAGADPVAAARVLAALHRRWHGLAAARWPWLRRVGAGSDLVEELYRRVWPELAERGDVPPKVADLGWRLIGRVRAAGQAVGRAGPVTLLHGDASLANMRTGPGGEVVLLDWEDVSAGPGVLDVVWLLVSSVNPDLWGDVLVGYGDTPGVEHVLPAIGVQALLSLSHTPTGSAEAKAWCVRIEAASDWLEACS